MKGRRCFFLAASTLGGAIAVASACSFPEPTLVDSPDDDASSSSGDSGDAQALADVVFDNVFAIDGNQNVDPDGGSQEAAVAPEAGLVDSSGCPDKCDCDEDTVRSDNPTCPNPGNDCNDLDPFIPHDGFVASKPVGHSGDWDCDGKVTKQHPVNIGCGLIGDCSAQGFKDDPPCGVLSTYVFCKQGLALPGVPLVCVEDRTETRIQGCR